MGLRVGGLIPALSCFGSRPLDWGGWILIGTTYIGNAGDLAALELLIVEFFNGGAQVCIRVEFNKAVWG